MSTERPVLYSFWRSSCSWRVRIALSYKGIQYDIKPINIIKPDGDQHTEEYRKINPMQRIPALYIDGHTHIESMNILHYLEETRPERPLMPSDPINRSKVRAICEVICCGIQPLQNIGLLDHMDAKEHKEFAQKWINKGFNAVEKLLSESAGKYCVGDNLTLADCCLAPQVQNARVFDVDLTPFPIISRIDKELEDHPAFKNTHPRTQAGYPNP